MSEPLDRARRIVTTGAIVLGVVLVALGAAAWKLVEVEAADAAVRGRSAAALGAEDLTRELADFESLEATGPILDVSGDDVVHGVHGAYPPRPFRPMPALADSEAAFWITESEGWEPGLRRAALRRAVRSRDVATRVAAASAGGRLELREGTGRAAEWADAAGEFDELGGTRDGVFLGLLRPSFPWEYGGTGLSDDTLPHRRALSAVGSSDDVDARAMLTVLAPDKAVYIRPRREALAAVKTLLPAFRAASIVDGRFGASLLPTGDAVTAARAMGGWRVRLVQSDHVQSTARKVLGPRGLRLVHADARSLPSAVDAPGGAGWAVDAAFPSSESRSRSGLLLTGLAVAAGASVLAFAAFARSVRRDARLSALRTEFVATVSHELRTPVAVVRTAAETLAAGRATTDADRAALTGAIVRESERLSDLVGNVLDFARMEAGRRTYEFRRVDVGVVVRDAAGRCEEASIDVADDLPAVRCDPAAIGAAVGNLIENASKFSPPGSRCAIRAYSRGGDVVIEVEDHGIGVPDSEKHQVFERFFRGSDPRVRETRGAGIGLALVRHTAEAHGGRVEVADTPGGGATFRIVLPVPHNGAT